MLTTELNSEILLTIKLQQQLFVDPKRIRLLKEIQQCGSINQAAKNAQVSYKSAWDHLEIMNKISPKPLLERNTGGKNGGGTQLTTYACELLQLYNLLEQTQQKAFSILQDESVPLNSLLFATTRFSLQSSARNQFFGNIKRLIHEDIHCYIDVHITDFPHPLRVSITAQSAVRLQLVLEKEVLLMIKAPWVKISHQATSQPNNYPAAVKSIIDKNDFKEVILSLSKETELCAIVPNDEQIALDQLLWFSIDPEQVILATL